MLVHLPGLLRFCEVYQPLKTGHRKLTVHSGPTSALRTNSLEQLRNGELDLICSVDMFNEGLDLPAIDTVMMLRPTESPVLGLQQFGRGLRKSDDKPHLTVIDYIGNHRIFFSRPSLILGKDQNNLALQRLLDELKGYADFGLPEGCVVDFDLVAIELLESLLKREPKDVFLAWYNGFKELYGRRPTASEALHQGYNPSSVRQKNGSWLGFLQAQQEFDPATSAAYEQFRDFLIKLENTKLPNSAKMVLLQGMLNLEALPGAVAMPKLAAEFFGQLERSAKLQADLSIAAGDLAQIRHLATHWTDEAPEYFRFQEDRFLCDLQPSAELTELIDEIVAWRLADYLIGAEEGIICRVGQKGAKPAILLPTRRLPDLLPTGPTQVTIDGSDYRAQFDRNEITIVQPFLGKADNLLPRLLRGWFGPEVGLPGTAHRVTLQKTEGHWTLKPLGGLLPSDGPVVGQIYSREQIPGLFGLPFSTGAWNKGYVTSPKHLFLLVTLSKTGMNKDHGYEDRFLPDGRFQWQSQNQTTQASGDGQRLKNHEHLGIDVHLFARPDKRSPFRYEGRLVFDDWQGDKPITIFWKVRGN